MTLAGLTKEAVIARVVARCIADKVWRSEAEKDALSWLQKNEKNRRADVETFVRAEYDAAGAGVSGRWQP